MFKLPTLPSVSSLTAAAASHIQAAVQLPGVAKLPIPTPISAESTEIHNKCYLFAQNKPSTQQGGHPSVRLINFSYLHQIPCSRLRQVGALLQVCVDGLRARGSHSQRQKAGDTGTQRNRPT